MIGLFEFRPGQPRRTIAAGFAACIALYGCASTAARTGADPARGTTASQAEARAITSDIAYLASDRLEGRGTGTPGNDSAAAYIARRFASLGLLRLDSSFEQHFVAHPLAAHNESPRSLPTQNVVALLPGTDSKLRGQFVVIGAHFDHLGRSTEGALDPDRKNVIRRGADDNASGTAAVLELARLFAATPAKRSLLFVTFSGEELGLLGSDYFATHSPLPLDSAVAMVNFDMVGRLRDDKLIVYGVATAAELPAIVDKANSAGSVGTPLRLTALGDGFGPSDHSSFYARGIPVLHFFTDLHEDYHSAGDVPSKINAVGEARVVDLAERVIRAIADRPSRLTFVRSAAPAPVAGSRQGSDVYLGSIPDMSSSAGQGLRLTGVRAGSPAEQAGLTAGDVIVEFAGRAVKDLYDFSDALYSHRPGDAVSVTVLRNGDRKQFTVHLGKRG
ncbi:MAG TPA: M28 family peptidase [Gemmatimonadaceae bacterium]|nr:M28 family peptidase [Gemmatimonadaceae bacterium]